MVLLIVALIVGLFFMYCGTKADYYLDKGDLMKALQYMKWQIGSGVGLAVVLILWIVDAFFV